MVTKYRKVDTPKVGDYRSVPKGILRIHGPDRWNTRVLAVTDDYVVTTDNDGDLEAYLISDEDWCREVRTVTVELDEDQARTFIDAYAASKRPAAARIANQIAEQLPEANDD